MEGFCRLKKHRRVYVGQIGSSDQSSLSSNISAPPQNFFKCLGCWNAIYLMTAAAEDIHSTITHKNGL